MVFILAIQIRDIIIGSESHYNIMIGTIWDLGPCLGRLAGHPSSFYSLQSTTAIDLILINVFVPVKNLFRGNQKLTPEYTPNWFIRKSLSCCVGGWERLISQFTVNSIAMAFHRLFLTTFIPSDDLMYLGHMNKDGEGKAEEI